MTTTAPATLKAFTSISTHRSHTLILGSMPGVASLQDNQYYAHPRNAFWPIICGYFERECDDYNDRLALIKRNQLALWDVIKSCEREGSLDSNIKSASVECNDFPAFLAKHPQIKHIVLNGKTAEKLFKQHASGPVTAAGQRVPTLHVLPSTSPAMASLNLQQKMEIWHQVLDKCYHVGDPAASARC